MTSIIWRKFWMKIDMSPEAITQRLKTAAELRRLCLALADSSAGREVRRKFHDEPQVRRIDESLPSKRGGDFGETTS